MSDPCRGVVVLGSTGTIGRSTIEVIRGSAGRFRVVGLACHGDVECISRQIAEFKPEAVYTEEATPELAEAFPQVRFLHGRCRLEELATLDGIDILVAAVPGVESLPAVMKALQRGITVCLASKEVLVAAGEMVMDAAAQSGARILPVDSEHNAVFQLLEKECRDDVTRIYLTASGGPFLRRRDLSGVTRQDVLAHPVWKMGAKITVDSATMMNKCFEMIEAHHLFSLPGDQIGVLIHPEAIVHGLVEFSDGMVRAVLSLPDMKFAIAHALHYPGRARHAGPGLRLGDVGRLTFEEPDQNSAWLRLARTALDTAGSFPASLVCANDEAVALFLHGAIPFHAIVPLVTTVLEGYTAETLRDVDAVMSLAGRMRRKVRERAQRFLC